MNKVYYESYDINKVKYLLSLNKKELGNVIKSEKKEENTKQYTDSLRSLLKDIIKTKDGVLRTTYRNANGMNDGRLYSNGFRLQGVCKNIRNFIVAEGARDFDMKNCFPSLLLYLCDKHINNRQDIYPLLTEYVNNRAHILSDNKITKSDILINMNMDKPKTKNEYLKRFVKEQKYIKEILIKYADQYTDSKTENTKNPISSTICQMLCVLENKILTDVTKYFREVSLIFDGFVAFNENVDIDTLNSQTKEYGIEWDIKPFTTSIVMPEDFKYDDYYEDKRIFEMDNHIIRNPMVYMRRSMGEWTTIDKSTIEQIYQNLPKYTEERIPFLKLWLNDPTRKEYEKSDFLPYNKIPPNIDTNLIFNTFTPFSRLESPIKDMEYDKGKDLISLVVELILCLCEENQILGDYLKKYIAHLIQLPEELPETIIVLQGEEGCGKDTLITIIERLLNNKNYVIRTNKPELILGRFNSLVKESLVIQLNEFSNKNAVEYKDGLKNMATEQQIIIEEKKVDRKQKVSNNARLFLFSNNDRPVVLGESNRRLCAFRTSNKHKQDRKFFGKINNLMKDERALNCLFHYFNGVDLSDYKPAVFPKGLLYDALQEDSVHTLWEFLYNIKTNDLRITSRKNGYDYIKSTDLRAMFLEHGRERGYSNFNMKMGAIKLLLKKHIEYISFVKIQGYEYIKFKYSNYRLFLKEKYFSKEIIEEFSDSDIESDIDEIIEV